eukprot:m51a1_g2801 hypothetical protein (127) ;mRNA; r:92713-93271
MELLDVDMQTLQSLFELRCTSLSCVVLQGFRIVDGYANNVVTVGPYEGGRMLAEGLPPIMTLHFLHSDQEVLRAFVSVDKQAQSLKSLRWHFKAQDSVAGEVLSRLTGLTELELRYIVVGEQTWHD